VVECVTGRINEVGEFAPWHRVPFKALKQAAAGSEHTYGVDLASAMSHLPMEGLRHYEVRAYPHHRLQAHPFECGCMRWL